MTDNTETLAAEIVARKLTAAEIVFSFDYVNKIVKKVHKDNPGYSAQQIADALETAFEQKLASTVKKLAGLEKTRREYSVLRAAQPVVQAAVDLISDAAVLDYVEQPLPAQTPAAKPAAKSKAKTNGAAKPDTAQTALNL